MWSNDQSKEESTSSEVQRAKFATVYEKIVPRGRRKTLVVGDMEEIAVEEEIDAPPDLNNLQKLVTSQSFVNFFFVAIIVNTVILTIPNYAHVNSSGEIVETQSLRNRIYLESDMFFVVLFTVEAVLQMGAFGVFGENAYFSNQWSWLDFTLVLAGWVAYIPGVKNFSVLRLMRILRPLKLFAKQENLQKVLTIVFTTIPKLRNVFYIFFFVVTFFSIVGLHLFLGPQWYARCRLTPYPVHFNWTEGDDFEAFRCLNADNINLASDYPTLSKESSPWAHPLPDCWWPVDETDERLCALGPKGLHSCFHDVGGVPVDQWRWCGSDFDGFGNPRYVDHDLNKAAMRTEAFNWGFSNFDHFRRGIFIAIPTITLDDWGRLMFFCQDAFDPVFGGIFFVSLIVVGNYIVLNLILMEVNSSMEEYKDAEEAKKIKAEIPEEKKKEEGVSARSALRTSITYSTSRFCNPWAPPLKQLIAFATMKSDFVAAFVNSTAFIWLSTTMIVANAVFLALQKYPMTTAYSDVLDVANFVFSMFFALECALTIIASGLFGYFSQLLNCFEFIIIFAAFVAAVLYPPSIMVTSQSHRNFGNSINAFRTFRMLQLFNVVTKYLDFQDDAHVMSDFIARIKKTLYDMASFGVVLFIFIYVMALVGMQYFANRLRFDESGKVINSIKSPEWENAPDRPRYNFDNFWLAFTTVFQLIVGEKAFAVSIDIFRSRGYWGMAYPIFIVIFGGIFMLNQLQTLIINDIKSRESGSEADIKKDKAEYARLFKAASSFISSSPSSKRSSKATPVKIDKASTKYADSPERRSSKIKEWLQGAVTPEFKADISIADFPMMEENKKDVVLSKPVSRWSLRDDWDSLTYCIHLGYSVVQTKVIVWINSHFFHAISLFAILLSSIGLALQNQMLDPNSYEFLTLNAIDLITSFFFVGQVSLEVVALAPSKYFRSFAHVADLIITIISVVGIVDKSNAQVKAIRSLKTLRAFKSLRVFKTFSGLKSTVKGVLGVVPDVTMIACLFAFILFVFGIFTVSGLSGQFRSCGGQIFDDVVSTNAQYLHHLNFPQTWNSFGEDKRSVFGPNNAVFEYLNITGEAAAMCTGWPDLPCCLDAMGGQWAPFVGSPLVGTSRSFCECWGGSWKKLSELNFDDIFQAMILLFEATSGGGWMEMMYYGAWAHM